MRNTDQSACFVVVQVHHPLQISLPAASDPLGVFLGGIDKIGGKPSSVMHIVVTVAPLPFATLIYVASLRRVAFFTIRERTSAA